MEQLVSLLAPGSAAVAVIAVVVIFLKLLASMSEKNQQTITTLLQSQEKARDGYFIALREVTSSHERIQLLVAERFEGLERAVEDLAKAVTDLKGR